MTVYIFILMLYIIIYFIESNSKIYNNKTMLKIWNFMLSLPVWIMVAFRSAEVGTDTHVYERLYNLYNAYDSSYVYSHYTMEKGYIALCRLCGRFGLSYELFQVLIATVTIFSFSFFIYKYSENCAYSWIIFITLLFMARSMNIMREMFTVSLSLFGIGFLKNRKYSYYIVLICILASIHMSAIVLFVVLGFEWIKNARLKKRITIIACICLPLFFRLIATRVTYFIGRYSHLLDSIYTDVEGGIAMYFYIAIALFVNIWYALVKTRTIIENNSLKACFFCSVWENFLYIAIILCFGGLRFGLMDRVALYYTVSYLVLIPNLTKREKKYNKTILSYGIILVLFVYFMLVLLYRNEWHRIVPYSFFEII